MEFSVTPLDWTQTIFVAFVGIVSFIGGACAVYFKMKEDKEDDREE